MDLAIETLFNSQFMNNEHNNSDTDTDTDNSSDQNKNQERHLSTCSLDSNNNNKQFEEESKQFNNSLLDPLSVIIKLAILSNKPVGTKLLMKENIIHIQEPGLFQGFARYISKTNRNDLHYLYNPIHFACQMFLNKEQRKKNPNMVDLFICAQNGISKLIETYQGYANATIRLCLNYYYVLIDNYVKERYTKLFRKDETTKLYTDLLLSNLNNLWSHEKIKIVLDMIQFLSDDKMANDNVKSLDVFIQNMDKHTQPIISSQIQ
jgi:hypothetical protein